MDKCRSCDFWHKAEHQYIYGDCHRYPPQPDISVSMKPARYGEGGEVSMIRRAQPIYPNTHEEDWCGEYRFTRKIQAQMTDTPRVFLAAYHGGLSPRYEVVPEGAMGAEPWVPEGAGVRVKALEWEYQEDRGIWTTKPCSLVSYIVIDSQWACLQGEAKWEWVDGGDKAAKAAAQADYEARIRVALDLTTEPEREPVEWTPPHDREDGYRCLGWYGGQWNPVNWRTYQDYSEWTDDEWMDFSPEAFAPMPSNPGERPTSGAYDLICCTAEDVVQGRAFTGDAAADLATAQESLRACLEQLRWRG